jgi:protein phosphatase-4 regulatory subunit 3
MERLTKSKKPDIGMQKERSGFGTGRTKNGDDPPKRFKVKFGTASLALTPSPSTPVPSEMGAKDGDTG